MKPIPTERTAFGLIAWLEQTRIVLPLKGVECAFKICGEVAEVEIDQIFQQNNSQPLDCLYTFPLPAAAAVYRCEMHVNGRVTRARVEEREQARALAREYKAAGHRTALVEMERDNLFTLSLGNVQPGDVIVVRLAYFQTLTRLGDWTSLNMPFCPGVRYIPGTPLLRAPSGRGVADDTDQVPDASRISPPRMDRLHPDAAYLSLSGTVEHDPAGVADISSPSHPVWVRSGANGSAVTLADQGAVPDRDFVLRWTEVPSKEVKPKGWIVQTKEETFALVHLRAPKQVATVETYAQDIYFLIDRSGSMQGLKWQKACEAFRAFLRVLGREDRVWATLFESHFRDFAEAPLPAAKVLGDPFVEKLEALGAAGGTELLPALEHVLGKVAAHSTAGRPASLLLITDGEVGNEAALLDRLARHANLRVHVFGIDATINDGLLQKLAAQHHGTSCLLSPRDDIVGAVERLGVRLRRPALTSIRAPEGWELPGHGLPDLYADEVMSLVLKAEPHVAQKPGNELRLEGRLPDGARREYVCELGTTDLPALGLLWAKRRIEFLLAQGKSPEAIALAKASNLVCEGAAFVAWDDAEKVMVSGPNRELYQPALASPVLACALAPPAAAPSELFEFRAGGVSDHSKARDPSDLHEGLWGTAFGSARAARLRAAPSETPRLTDWRDELGRDELFRGPAGRELLDRLVSWASSGQPDREVCSAALEALARQLKAIQNHPGTERLELVRAFIKGQLEGERRREALAKLRALEVELGLTATA